MLSYNYRVQVRCLGWADGRLLGLRLMVPGLVRAVYGFEFF